MRSQIPSHLELQKLTTHSYIHSFYKRGRLLGRASLCVFDLSFFTDLDLAAMQALKEIRRCLTPDEGTFIMVDPFRQKGETLEAYRKRASEVTPSRDAPDGF